MMKSWCFLMLNLDNENILYQKKSPGSGQQEKFWIQKDNQNIIVKLDSKYRESKKEKAVSDVLDIVGYNHVCYFEDNFLYDGQKRKGCYSYSFLNEGETSFNLFQAIEHLSVPNNLSAVDYFNGVVNTLYVEWGMDKEYTSEYILTLMALDFIFMNKDRHLGNIELIDNGSIVRFSPYFDFGQSFLRHDGVNSQEQFKKLERGFKTMPFSTSPKNNLISIPFAKYVCQNILTKVGSIYSLPISEYYKFVIKNQVDKLLKY